MKKILFSAYSLDVGGIETALITLLKNLANKYEITLVLEKNQGTLLDKLPKNIKVVSYEPSHNKVVIIRKMINLFKQIKFKLKYKNKFDFAGCYATYSFPGSFVARNASKNSCLWVHSNYMSIYNNNVINYRKFFNDLKVHKYKKIVFVSELDKRAFIAQFPECKKKAITCHNLIDYKAILQKSEEQVEDYKKQEGITTLINIGRHNEEQKKLTRIIKATKKLNKEGYKFRVIFVGKGSATKQYIELAKDIPNIEFLGEKKNPYPYLKESDALVMSSDIEGYPVVFVEAEILGKPIITTDVSDAQKDIKEKKHGIVVEKSEKGVYKGMKEFLKNGYTPEEFDPKKYNDEILEKLEKIIN